MPRPRGAANRKMHQRAHELRPAPCAAAGGMFARAVSAARVTPCLIAALVAVCGCGGDSQDADEPEGSYRLEVADASFPAKQSIAEATTMRISIRNPERRTVPNVAVTVETQGGKQSGGALPAFGQKEDAPRLADANRAIWVLDREPEGGTSAYANTWTLGALRAGRTKTFEWKL